MRLQKIYALRGPNVWGSVPAVEAWVDLEDLADVLPRDVPGCAARLRAWLAALDERPGGENGCADIAARIEQGASPAEALGLVAARLQAIHHAVVGPPRSRPTALPAVFRVAVPCRDEEFARACVEAAIPLYQSAVHGWPYDTVSTARDLGERAGASWPGVFVETMLAVAQRRGIPTARPYPELMASLVFLGQGARLRRLGAGARTSGTSALAEILSTHKALTKALLRDAGFPVPVGRLVADAADAWKAACALGTPVVIKPCDADYGRGVAIELSTREQVVAAFEAASLYSEQVLAERYVRGDEYRLLVVGGRVVAAARREPPHVVGDGRASVAELVARLNDDPRRGDGNRTILARVALDEAAGAVLAGQGLDAASVPEEGRRVFIRRDARRWSGGSTSDVTDEIHPELARTVADAVGVVGLDVAGADIVAHDIHRPLDARNGAIIEINAEPALVPHLRPTYGRPRPVVEAILDLMFPAHDTGRIPVAVVTGTNGKTTTTRLLAHLLRASGRTVGMTCSDGIYLQERCIEAGDCSGPNSARAILRNPLVETAVLETARGGILTGGLGFDRCDVAVVTNLGGGDHLGSHGIETLDALAEVKATVLKTIGPGGAAVLNAGDPYVVALAARCAAPVVYFGLDEGCALVEGHRALGGRAAFVRAGTLVWAEGHRETELLPLDDLPLAHAGAVRFQVENALAAAAAALALGVPVDVVHAGLRAFRADPQRAPARFNVFEINGGVLVLDYAHNASALRALAEALARRFPDAERTIAYSGAGNRRDADLVEQGRAIGDGFDRVWLYEDQCNYRRPEGAVISLLRQGLDAGARVREVHVLRGEFAALQQLIDGVSPNVVAVFVPESIEEAIAFLSNHRTVEPIATA